METVPTSYVLLEGLCLVDKALQHMESSVRSRKCCLSLRRVKLSNPLQCIYAQYIQDCDAKKARKRSHPVLQSSADRQSCYACKGHTPTPTSCKGCCSGAAWQRAVAQAAPSKRSLGICGCLANTSSRCRTGGSTDSSCWQAAGLLLQRADMASMAASWKRVRRHHVIV